MNKFMRRCCTPPKMAAILAIFVLLLSPAIADTGDPHRNSRRRKNSQLKVEGRIFKGVWNDTCELWDIEIDFICGTMEEVKERFEAAALNFFRKEFDQRYVNWNVESVSLVRWNPAPICGGKRTIEMWSRNSLKKRGKSIAKLDIRSSCCGCFRRLLENNLKANTTSKEGVTLNNEVYKNTNKLREQKRIISMGGRGKGCSADLATKLYVQGFNTVVATETKWVDAVNCYSNSKKILNSSDLNGLFSGDEGRTFPWATPSCCEHEGNGVKDFDPYANPNLTACNGNACDQEYASEVNSLDPRRSADDRKAPDSLYEPLDKVTIDLTLPSPLERGSKQSKFHSVKLPTKLPPRAKTAKALKLKMSNSSQAPYSIMKLELDDFRSHRIATTTKSSQATHGRKATREYSEKSRKTQASKWSRAPKNESAPRLNKVARAHTRYWTKPARALETTKPLWLPVVTNASKAYSTKASTTKRPSGIRLT